MNIDDLKPCPFCGGKAHAWQWNGGARIDCENWRTDMHYIGIEARTMEEAVRIWNNRPNASVGHWIVIDHAPNAPDGYPEYYCACSSCNNRFLDRRFKYCPDCGAKMSEPTDFQCSVPDVFREYYESLWE